MVCVKVGMIELIKDKYLTWRTGLNKQDRDWYKWQGGHIIKRATTIEDMFTHFKYILPVSTNIFDLNDPFGWNPNKEFKQYMYPNRTLGDNTVYYFARGYRDKWDGKFHLNDLRHDQDQVFVATNNSKDALMIALKYS
jgi:hypothetical protein